MLLRDAGYFRGGTIWRRSFSRRASFSQARETWAEAMKHAAEMSLLADVAAGFTHYGQVLFEAGDSTNPPTPTPRRLN